MGDNPPPCHPPRWMLATSQPSDHFYGLQTNQGPAAGAPGPPETVFSGAPISTASNPAGCGYVLFEEATISHCQAPFTPISNYSDHPLDSVPLTPYDESSRQLINSAPVPENSYHATHVLPVSEPFKSDDAPDSFYGWQATPAISPPHICRDQYASPMTPPFSAPSRQELFSKSPPSITEPIQRECHETKQPLETAGVNNPHESLHPRPLCQQPEDLPSVRKGSTRFGDDAARQRALERNRQAANRCRHRKRDQASALANLEYEIEEYHRYLSESLQSLNTEVLQLKSELLRHTNCNCFLIQTYLGFEAVASVNNMVGIHPACGAPASAASSTVESLGLLCTGTGNGPIHWVNPQQPEATALCVPSPQSESSSLRHVPGIVDTIEPATSSTTQPLSRQIPGANYTMPEVHRQSPNHDGSCATLWGPQ